MDIIKLNEKLHGLLEELDGEQLHLSPTRIPAKTSPVIYDKVNVEYNFDNGVSVSSHEACTNFINKKFLPLLNEQEVRAKFKKLMSLCRELGVKVKGRKNAEAKFATYPQYKAGIEKYNEGVVKLQQMWKEIVEEGIYVPINDNEKINAAHEFEWSIDPLLYGNGPISKFRMLAKDIDEYLDKLEYQKEQPEDTIFGKCIMIGF